MTEKKIGIIALDLDGTLLDSNKNLSAGNLAALERAAAAGIEIVPTTGRFYGGIPAAVRELPFIHYAITINGAQLADTRTGEVIFSAELPWEQSVELLKEFDGHPLIYDCYQDNCGWMTESMKADIDAYAPNVHYNKMLKEFRKPVPDLKAFITEGKKGVQKVQFFTNDLAFRETMIEELPKRFENISVSSSISNNVEVNQLMATKGEALKALARHLGLAEDATMAFGDALNDMSMVSSAGIGVAMANAEQELKDAADWITVSNDEDGVAKGILKFCFGEE